MTTPTSNNTPNYKVLDVKSFQYHPEMEELTNLIAARANTDDTHFIRTIIAFYLGIVASSQRVTVALAGDRPVPLNIYAIALAHSGAGKGVIVGELEQLLEPFTAQFTEDWELLREEVIIREGEAAAKRNGTDVDEEIAIRGNYIKKLGTPLLWFEEATSPALKQMRSAMLKVPRGGINFIMDEVLSASGTPEVLQDLVKSYDVGALKGKLIKHTNDSPRVVDDINGKVPAQMLLFGTGDLLQDPRIHDNFMAQLNSGLARRCNFAFAPDITPLMLSAEERYANLINTASGGRLEKFKAKIAKMVQDTWHGAKLEMNKAAHLYQINYQMWCEARAKTFADHILAAEMQHRYMKMVKFAGILAMWDGSPSVKVLHLQQSIKFIEDGGTAVVNVVKSAPLHVRLAEYLAKTDRMTMSQLVIDLPWFSSQNKQQKQELITLAIQYGYSNNIIITVETVRNIEYIQGTLITRTDLSRIRLSMSEHQAYNYANGFVEWEKLADIVCKEGVHWVNHHLNNGLRSEDTVIEGFNVVVLDIDNKPEATSNIPLHMAKQLLNEYTHMVYESKSSTPEYNRYRIVLPLSHNLTFDKAIFSEFMKNIYEWLPFEVDEVTDQRSRKWLGFDRSHSYHDAKLLPALEFIPDTEKQIQHSINAQALSSLTAVDRWFVGHINSNPAQGRNNGLLRYSMLLVDAGMAQAAIESSVLAMNAVLSTPLEESEINSTIFQSIAKKLAKP